MRWPKKAGPLNNKESQAEGVVERRHLNKQHSPLENLEKEPEMVTIRSPTTIQEKHLKITLKIFYSDMYLSSTYWSQWQTSVIQETKPILRKKNQFAIQAMDLVTDGNWTS